MFTVHDACSKGILRITACDRLSHDDYASLVPQMEAFLQRCGGDRCWIELTDFLGVEPGSLVDVSCYDVHLCRQIGRCVIIGNRAWSLCMCRFAQAVFPAAEIRYFEPRDADEAYEWIRQLVAHKSPLPSPVLVTV
ncbi:MAG: STAS/SEC14 domain-containing protein [Pirellulales bacterium]|nr:STAS/SEC14 domain-containing protein [Pirellulales bacterium]